MVVTGPGDCPEGGLNNPPTDDGFLYDCDTYGGTCEDCLDPDSADNAEDGDCYELVIEIPAAPANLTGSSSNDGVNVYLDLSWDASEGATSYNVYLDDG